MDLKNDPIRNIVKDFMNLNIHSNEKESNEKESSEIIPKDTLECLVLNLKRSSLQGGISNEKYPIKNCKIHLINTGKNSMTGGRLLRLENFLNKEENFLATYGDGLSNVNLNSLIRFHLNKKKIATLTSVRPPVRFGEVKFNDSKIVTEFKEKQQSSQNWINGGFFIFSREIFKYIKDDMTVLEKKPFEKLVKIKQLATYTHRGFWQCMDTMREKIFLNNLWIKKKAPWKNWKK